MTNRHELYHHGIKGQKWGVRRYQNKDGSLTEEGKRRHQDDLVIKKGQIVGHVSANKNLKLRKNLTYIYANNYDAAVYRGRYASYLNGGNDVSDYAFKAKADIAVPSAKHMEDTFKELYDSDPEAIKKALKTEYDYQQKRGRIPKEYSYDVVSSDPNLLYDVFRKNINGYCLYMAQHNEQAMNHESYSAAKRFVQELKDQKYSAMLDINDIDSFYGAKAPIVILDGKKYLKKAAVNNLKYSDVQAYCSMLDAMGAVNKQNPTDSIIRK